MNVAADPNQSTAPDNLQNCVVKALEGVKLDPPDQREGQATFEWVFRGPEQPAQRRCPGRRVLDNAHRPITLHV